MVSDAHDTFRLRDGAVRVVVDGVVGDDECDDVEQWLALVQRKFRRNAAQRGAGPQRPVAEPEDPKPAKVAEVTPTAAPRVHGVSSVARRKRTDGAALTPMEQAVVDRMRGEGPVTIATLTGNGLVYGQVASALSQLRKRGLVRSFDDADGHRVHELVDAEERGATNGCE